MSAHLLSYSLSSSYLYAGVPISTLLKCHNLRFAVQYVEIVEYY